MKKLTLASILLAGMCLFLAGCGSSTPSLSPTPVVNPTIESRSRSTIMVVGDEMPFFINIVPASSKGLVSSVNMYAGRGDILVVLTVPETSTLFKNYLISKPSEGFSFDALPDGILEKARVTYTRIQ